MTYVTRTMVQRPRTLEEALEATKEILFDHVEGVSRAGGSASSCRNIVRCIKEVIELEHQLSHQDPIRRLSDDELKERIKKLSDHATKKVMGYLPSGGLSWADQEKQPKA